MSRLFLDNPALNLFFSMLWWESFSPVNQKNPAPSMSPKMTTYGAEGNLLLSSIPFWASEKTEAEIIIPAAMADDMARTRFELALRKWTGIAPRPVASALKIPVKAVQ